LATQHLNESPKKESNGNVTKKSTVTKMKNALDSVISRLPTAKETISELEDR
jgi:division protein CdvB (Snf7/Vps24/ESCRT-III family)